MSKILILLCLLQSFALLGQNSQAFKHYQIDITSSRTDFFSLIDQVEIIRLEETDASLLSSARNYLKTPMGFGFMHNNEISLFDDFGNNTGVIRKQGQGPKEYESISSAWVREGQVEVYSSKSRSINVFNLAGKYMKTIPSQYPKEWRGGTMLPMEGGYLLHLLDPSWKDKSEYALVKLNFALEPIKTIKLNSDSHPFPVNLGKRFGVISDQIFYKKVLNDSLFLIENDQVIPLMRFDFGKDWHWSDERTVASIRAASVSVLETEKIIEVLSDVGSQYILLTYLSGLSTRVIDYALINRMNDVVRRLDLRKSDKENFDIFFIKWQKDQLIASLPVDQIEEFVSKLGSGQYHIAGGVQMEELLNYENPILLKIKLK